MISIGTISAFSNGPAKFGRQIVWALVWAMVLALASSWTSYAKPAKEIKKPVRHYIEFRARTAASYGHAFVWYGRTDRPEVHVAGLHPATNSAFRYLVGHLLPVPAETGASYGDLDERYLTAKYRVYLNDLEARKTIAYIRYLKQTTKFWHARANNCVTFLARIADHMGLRIPEPLDALPDDWVKGLRRLNGPEPGLVFRN